MNIGIDVNCIIFEKAGFGRYTYNLVKNLLKIDRKNQYFLYANFIRKKAERGKIIGELISETKAKNATVRIINFPARWKEWLIGTRIPYQFLIKEPLDVYFAPHFAGVAKNGFPNTVVAVHDLAFMYYPEHRGKNLSNYYLKRTKIALTNSKKMIAVSRATKKDIEEKFKIPSRKITVIPEAATENFKPCKNDQLILQKTVQYVPKGIKYLLAVGTLEPRKNLSSIIKAFSLLPNDLKRNYKLVFVGGAGWNNEDFLKTIKNYNMGEKVILTGFVNDKDLPYIYNRANVFIFPSFYEGFGLPPLEAMASGTPVICSGSSSLPEVVGGAGILVNPVNEEEQARAIKKLLFSPKLAKKLSLRGIKQAKKFSWNKVATATLKVLEEAGASHPKKQ